MDNVKRIMTNTSAHNDVTPHVTTMTSACNYVTTITNDVWNLDASWLVLHGGFDTTAIVGRPEELWVSRAPSAASSGEGGVGGSSSSSYLSTYSIESLLWMFVGPAIFVIGLSGNALILLVMSRRRMRGTSTCVYLTLMALADSMVLITGMIPEWLEACRIVIIKV